MTTARQSTSGRTITAWHSWFWYFSRIAEIIALFKKAYGLISNLMKHQGRAQRLELPLCCRSARLVVLETCCVHAQNKTACASATCRVLGENDTKLLLPQRAYMVSVSYRTDPSADTVSPAQVLCLLLSLSFFFPRHASPVDLLPLHGEPEDFGRLGSPGRC